MKTKSRKILNLIIIIMKNLFKRVRIKHNKKCNVFLNKIIINSNVVNDYNNINIFYVARVIYYLNNVILT